MSQIKSFSHIGLHHTLFGPLMAGAGGTWPIVIGTT